MTKRKKPPNKLPDEKPQSNSRSTRLELEHRHNRVRFYKALRKNTVQIIAALMQEFGVSERMAYRYFEAVQAEGEVTPNGNYHPEIESLKKSADYIIAAAFNDSDPHLALKAINQSRKLIETQIKGEGNVKTRKNSTPESPSEPGQGFMPTAQLEAAIRALEGDGRTN